MGETANTLHEAFFEQANKTPQQVAVTDSLRKLSYSELASQVRFLAKHLIEQGYGKTSIIGIYSDTIANHSGFQG